MKLLGLPRNSTAWGETETFRRNSKKLFRHYGTNLQNPSPEICRIYVPDDGYQFVQVDQSGAEALIVAYECEEGNFRSLFRIGIKPHVFVAMHLFHDEWQRTILSQLADNINNYLSASIESLPSLPNWKVLEKAIKKHDRNYAVGKMVCHASNYNMTAGTFVDQVLEKSESSIILSRKQAEYYLDLYHQLFPEIRRWHKRTQHGINTTRTLRNLFGFPRYFGGTIDDSLFREAYAFVPQSTVGCITANAITAYQEYIEEHRLDWHFLNDKHDSFLTECPVSKVMENAKVMKRLIEQELVSSRGEKFRMKSEAQAGFNWAKKSESNPLGMEEIKF